MHADRTNRAALIVFGVVVFLAGAAGLAGSVGLFGKGLSHRTLFDNAISAYIGHQGQWLWPTFAVLCVLIALLCLRWVLTLLTSTDRAGDLTLPGDKSAGRTVIQPAAITNALTCELASYRGVDHAKARIIGDPSDPRVVVAVSATRESNLGTLRVRIENEAFAHLRHALELPNLPVQLDLDVTGQSSIGTG